MEKYAKTYAILQKNLPGILRATRMKLQGSKRVNHLNVNLVLRITDNFLKITFTLA